MDRPVDQEETAQEDREHDEVEGQRLPEIEHAQERAARHRLDAVLTARELGLQAEEVRHLGEGQRDVREVDALAADRQRADDHPEARRDGRAEEDRELRREAPRLRRVGRAIAGRAQESGVTEGQEPDVADQEVEGAREEREAERLHEEHRVHEERRRHQRRHHHAEGDDLMRGHGCHRPDADGRGGGVGSRGHVARPKRPAGRTSSTSTMMTKITVLDASG